MQRSVHDIISKRKRRAQTLEFKLFEEVFPIKQILDVPKIKRSMKWWTICGFYTPDNKESKKNNNFNLSVRQYTIKQP